MTQQDIDNVFHCLAADIRMIAQKTGLWNTQECGNYIEDVKDFMDGFYLKHIYLILKGESNHTIKARRYDIAFIASNKQPQRPGGNNWDEYGGTALTIVLSHTDKWHKLSEAAKQDFKAKRKIKWSTSKEDTAFKHLNQSAGRYYKSNDLNVQRIEFGK